MYIAVLVTVNPTNVTILTISRNECMLARASTFHVIFLAAIVLCDVRYLVHVGPLVYVFFAPVEAVQILLFDI